MSAPTQRPFPIEIREELAKRKFQSLFSALNLDNSKTEEQDERNRNSTFRRFCICADEFTISSS